MYVATPPIKGKQSILEYNEFNKQDSQSRNFRKTISDRFLEFSRSTSIHGFKYLGVRQGCTLEKIWWIVVLSICIYLCTFFTIQTLKKREENPVFISFHQPNMHIWDIPFPAVTICPGSKIKATKYNFTQYSNRNKEDNLTGGELKRFRDMSLFCKSDYHCPFSEQGLQHSLSEEAVDDFIKHSVTIDDVFELCKTNRTPYKCNEFLSPTLTMVGLCFSFNMLDKTELFHNITSIRGDHVRHNKTRFWTADDNYAKTMNRTVPMRITSINDGLYFRLHLNKSDIDELCDKSQGYRVMLHHPAEVPLLSQRHTHLSTDQSYKFWIKPNIITTSTNLKDYDPHKRGCYFANEKKLKYYKVYTEPNCREECLSNYTIKICGCALYHLPHEKSSRLCGHSDIACVFTVKEKLLSIEMKFEILEDNSTFRDDQWAEGCDCLPSCTSITYDAEIVPEQMATSPNSSFFSTTVYFTFKDSNFITMERNELFSNTDFWASCGGLLGLFTGFSVVSLAEIVYFSTLKWICNLWNNRK
ncbi:hypothetical protein Zmor_013473 [Zophobas morio]|uniref:Sodium channel protein Nach n=1 Tax=Zophobas morio TaxID=2755281 RepID=A0AA38MFI2_9CUCU|nr:hypothetical protein Zmor_013473 [Zophobas morio]